MSRDLDWESLYKAINYVSGFCRTYGRLGGQAKEKYGQMRFYASFGYLSLQTLIYPGYVYNRLPKWLNILDYYISPALQFLFEKSFVKWQEFIYSTAYNRALKKWPHLRSEILCGADWPLRIKGAARVEETETQIITHILGWEGETIGQWIQTK